MKKLLSMLLILAFAMLPLGAAAQEPQNPASSATYPTSGLSNQDVLDMTKSGLTDEVIVAKIRNSPTHFDTSPSNLAQLKAAGLSDVIIMAMVTAGENRESAVKNTPVEVMVPDGTEIEIQLKNTLSGQEAKVGDIVDFTIVRDVQVNGVTVFVKDASARARVTTAKKSGRWGKAGKLEWAMQDLQAADGNRIPARFSKRELGDSKGGTVAVAAVATTVLLGPVGLLWGLKKGKAAVIPAGNRYLVFVHGDISVKVQNTSHSKDGSL
jgi:hypothetical protein